MKVEQEIEKLGYRLPEPVQPVAAYVTWVKTGNLVFLSGHAPLEAGKPTITGKLGKDLTEEQGYQIAQQVALKCLSTLKAAVGDLDKVERIVKVVGFINSAPGCNRQPWVLNGASELLVKVFGERGKHVRNVVGVSETPLDVPMLIEMIAEVRE